MQLLGLSPAAERGTRDWLDLLVALNLLQRQGGGEDAVYSNSREADAFMVKGGEGYIGDAFVLSHDRRALCPVIPMHSSISAERQPSAVRCYAGPGTCSRTCCQRCRRARL